MRPEVKKFSKKYLVSIVLGFILTWIYYKNTIINIYFIAGAIVISFTGMHTVYRTILRYLKRINLNQYYFYKKPKKVVFFWVLEQIYDLFLKSKAYFPKSQQRIINLYFIFFMIYKSITFSILTFAVSFIFLFLTTSS